MNVSNMGVGSASRLHATSLGTHQRGVGCPIINTSTSHRPFACVACVFCSLLFAFSLFIFFPLEEVIQIGHDPSNGLKLVLAESLCSVAQLSSFVGFAFPHFPYSQSSHNLPRSRTSPQRTPHAQRNAQHNTTQEPRVYQE